MIRARFLLLILISPLVAIGQSLTEAQQKAINNYITLVNHLSTEVGNLGPSLVAPYARVADPGKKSYGMAPAYSCRTSPPGYYYDEAKKTAAALASAGTAFVSKAEAVYNVWQQLDETCKAIEIYFRLKDYESDNYKKLGQLILTMEARVGTYSKAVKDLHTETEKLFAKLQPHNAGNAYHKADKLMRDQLAFEMELIDACTYNIHETVHTGWPVEKVQKHILDDTRRLEVLRQGGGGVQYPASSMYKSFVEGIESIQNTKRNGVDGYTFEKQQSDGHSNNVYKNLINYHNNVGVSFYNNFIKQSNQNGFRGIYYLNVVPIFNIRSTAKEISLDVTPFTDKPATEIKVAPVTAPISIQVFGSLLNYVEFINEGVRQVNHLMSSIHNLNSSASWGKSRLRSGGRVNLQYSYNSFELPVTLYQKTIDQSKSLPTAYQKPLTEQAEVLYSILTELNQWNNLLLAESVSKTLGKDSMDHVYQVFTRYKALTEIFDAKKEQLFVDVRKVFEAYKPVDPKSSWVISGNALRTLLDEDHKELVKSRKYLFGDASVEVNPQEIDRMVRDLITNEYKNLEGIQKYGRSNGLCPYTPYEDLATYSRNFLEAIDRARQGKVSSYYRHPYNALISHYNQSLAEKYNKFTELSKVPLLKAAYQLEIYEIVPPREVEQRRPVSPAVAETVVKPEETTPTRSEPVATGQRPRQPTRTEAGRVIHDTVRITDVIRIETVRQDTVYVSRVDTVYVGVPGENMLSMEGYATNNMVLLLDVSGSMNNPEKLPLLKKSVLLLMKMMRPEDQVSIVTYSGKARVELPPTSFKEEARITQVIAQLKSEGKTDGNAGIKLAYQVADKNYIRGGNNRIILATDGEFGIGNPTYELVKKYASEDIFITVFNFGKSTMSTKNLQQLATLGNGNYEYITRENVDMKLIQEAKAKRKK
jgi:Ca-activated chloride channel homolog